jgi:hypothetical protein
MLLCILNLVIYNIKLLLYFLPWNLKEKGSLDLNPLVARGLLMGCAWRCTCNKGYNYIKGIVYR